jgi:NAD+ synthase
MPPSALVHFVQFPVSFPPMTTSTSSPPGKFMSDSLRLDAKAAVEKIASTLREQVLKHLRRRGVVVGISGGIDSSVVVGLCVEAFGPKNVFGIFMPEEDSDPESLRLGRLVADKFGIDSVVEDIAPILAAAGCYKRRDDFIRQVFPEYGPEYKSKVVLPNALSTGGGYNISSLVIQSPSGEQKKERLPLPAYLGIVAATNMKQRTRKQIEYYHADRLNFAVTGTPNRLEYDQGFFVKNGDGAADVKPIAHLYKTQVYQLAEHLQVPEEVRKRPPTTDTYSLAQTQEEFFFSLPLRQLDLCLYALNHGISAADAAPVVNISAEQMERVYADIQSKRRTTRYQHEPPMLIEPLPEIHGM